jgi:X-X-X-Leu-X-X-Gly heptad repeat protein
VSSTPSVAPDQAPPQIVVGRQSYPISAIWLVNSGGLGGLSALNNGIGTLNSNIGKLNNSLGLLAKNL